VFVKPVNDVIFYFDRLGKLERYRRQIYSMTVTADAHFSAFYGVLSTYDFINTCDEVRITMIESGVYQHGVNEIYLVASRDGVSFDLDSVYARDSLVKRSSSRGSIEKGSIYPAAQLTFYQEKILLFYIAYRMPEACGPHEGKMQRETWFMDHFPRYIGVVSAVTWPRGRL